MTPTITGRNLVDESPGPHGRDPLAGDGASTGRLGDRLFGGLARGEAAVLGGGRTLMMGASASPGNRPPREVTMGKILYTTFHTGKPSEK